jgi:transcriptional regulator with XRE-family HTH domain
MVLRTDTEQRLIDFSARLNELLDARAFAAKHQGRQVALAKEVGLSQKAVRKWLEAEGMPELTRLIELAVRFDCHLEWLATGRGPRDLTLAPEQPHQRLVDRLRRADPATVRLVELALNDDDAAAAHLSPSLQMMVDTIKRAIAAEQDRHVFDVTHDDGRLATTVVSACYANLDTAQANVYRATADLFRYRAKRPRQQLGLAVLQPTAQDAMPAETRAAWRAWWAEESYKFKQSDDVLVADPASADGIALALADWYG